MLNKFIDWCSEVKAYGLCFGKAKDKRIKMLQALHMADLERVRTFDVVEWATEEKLHKINKCFNMYYGKRKGINWTELNKWYQSN